VVKDKPSVKAQIIFSFRGIGYVFWINLSIISLLSCRYIITPAICLVLGPDDGLVSVATEDFIHSFIHCLGPSTNAPDAPQALAYCAALYVHSAQIQQSCAFYKETQIPY
jgi:hypothetical protein